MVEKIDKLDLKILKLLQVQGEMSLDEIAQQVDSSRTPVWNRIRKMKNSGVIRRVVADLDSTKLGLSSCFFVMIRTAMHNSQWLKKFAAVVEDMPEIVEAHRLAGDVDYLLKVYTTDAQAFDKFYQRLVEQVDVFNVTSLLSMEIMKPHGSLPLEGLDEKL